MLQPNLAGKTALVTGGGRGIGSATAGALARAGARVVITARTQAEISAVAQEIGAAGGQSQAIAADVASPDLVEQLFDEAGPIDILINNASILQPVATVVDADPAAWRHNIAVNLDGVFFTCHYALPHMIDQRWGRIVNVSSGAARGSQTNWGAYSAAKAGVETLTRVLALEVGRYGIRANAVRPGIVDTSMQAEIRSSTKEQFGAENLARYRSYPQRGLLRPPEHAARLILWLLAPENDGTNGEVLAIDDPAVAARIGLAPMGR